MTAKLNAYIGCFNALDSKTHGSIESYTRWIKDVAAGPTGRETQVYGPFEISDYDMKQCDAPVTEAIAAKPVLAELDAAAGHYQQALKALVPISKDAHDYYDRQDYEDDQFAKGKQLHAPLMAAFKDSWLPAKRSMPSWSARTTPPSASSSRHWSRPRVARASTTAWR